MQSVFPVQFKIPDYTTGSPHINLRLQCRPHTFLKWYVFLDTHTPKLLSWNINNFSLKNIFEFWHTHNIHSIYYQPVADIILPCTHGQDKPTSLFLYKTSYANDAIFLYIIQGSHHMPSEVLTIAMTSCPELLNILKSTFNYFKAIQIHKFHLTRSSTFIVSLN